MSRPIAEIGIIAFLRLGGHLTGKQHRVQLEHSGTPSTIDPESSVELPLDPRRLPAYMDVSNETFARAFLVSFYVERQKSIKE